jgi:hypothetical protein
MEMTQESVLGQAESGQQWPFCAGLRGEEDGARKCFHGREKSPENVLFFWGHGGKKTRIFVKKAVFWRT